VVVDPQIFITYSSKDQAVARTICTALENRGLACWISSRNVRPGQNYQEQIVKAIRTAKIMVLVFTANANNSNEIKKELALASQNNLVVIPVRIEDVVPNEAFAYEFATRQWIDLFHDWENSIGHLVEHIAAAIDDHPSGNRAKAGFELTGDASAPSLGKPVMAASASAIALASFLARPSSRWAMISGLAVIVAAAIAYEAGTLLQQRSSSPVTVTAGSPAQSRPVAASPVPSEPVAQPQKTQATPSPTSPAASQQAALPAAAVDIAGKYSMHGTNPNGTIYRGFVTIHRDGDRYRFDWVISTGDTYRGTGVFNGRSIVVDWGQQYPVIYQMGPNGVLTGTWANGTATETLVPD
jgi:TIR domain-containing protein